MSALFYAPVALAAIFYWHASVSIIGVGFMAGSAALHTGYFVLLNEGYRAGDLSLVYPLARGTGPLPSSIPAIVLLGERPRMIAVAVGLMIVGAVIVLTCNQQRLSQVGVREASGY